jgi:peptide/nickel transport system substrate-binding protein
MYEQISSNKRKSVFLILFFLVLIFALSWVFAQLFDFGRPRIERLQYVAVGDRFLAMKNGEIDALALWSRTLDAVSEFQGNPQYEIMQGPSAWVLRVVFNHSRPVLARREIRQALAHALDLEDVSRRLRHGHVLPGRPGFLPSVSPWSNREIGPYRYDIRKARALVESAGLETLSFTLLAAPEYIREAEYVSSQSRKIGIELTVKSLPAATLDAKLREGAFEVAVSGHGGIGGDPDVLRRQFCTPAAPGERADAAAGPDMMRSYGYSNPELDRLGAAQLREFDDGKRRAMVGKMQEIIAEDVPTIALWYPKIYFVYRPDVLDGWFFSPGGVSIGIPTVENKLVYVQRRAR